MFDWENLFFLNNFCGCLLIETFFFLDHFCGCQKHIFLCYCGSFIVRTFWGVVNVDDFLIETN